MKLAKFVNALSAYALLNKGGNCFRERVRQLLRW
jgi:hypothetical protein